MIFKVQLHAALYRAHKTVLKIITATLCLLRQPQRWRKIETISKIELSHVAVAAG